MEDVISKIHNYTLEEIMGLSFGRYSKYIIQDRAIPDVRDGLKPVLRIQRIGIIIRVLLQLVRLLVNIILMVILLFMMLWLE